MVRFIFGGSKSGKSYYIHDKIKETYHQNTNVKILLIVPEQISFETETEIYNLLGAESTMRIEVISFKWLVRSIFREFGGISTEYASKSVKSLIMAETLYELESSLEFYRKNYLNSGFVSGLISVIKKFKNSLVSADILADTSLELENSFLANKIKDISLIYDLFDSKLKNKYEDENDSISHAANLIWNENYFKDYIVFFDEFDSFTVQEYKLIEVIIKTSIDVYFCLKYNPNDDRKFWDIPKITFNKLKVIANKNHIEISKPKILKSIYNKSPSLTFLCNNIFSENKCYDIEDKNSIFVIETDNLYSEISYVASCICDLIRNKNYRYRDFLIVCSDIDKYNTTIDNIFNEYNIPYFIDSKISIKNKFVIKFFICVLKVIVSDFETADVLSLAKSGFLPFDDDTINQLENYVYVWNINYGMWKKSFTLNPKGFNESQNNKEFEQELKNINSLRNYIVTNISDFKNEIKGKSAGIVIEQLYGLLIKLGLESYVQNTATSLYNKGDINLADDIIKSYEQLMDIIDLLHDNLKDKILSIENIFEYVKLVIDNFESGSIPQTLDCVFVCDRNRSVYRNSKALFVLDFTADNFPLTDIFGGIITKDDNNVLINCGLELGLHSSMDYYQEMFFMYKLMSCPSDRLFLCYHKVNFNGSHNYISIFADNIFTLFGKEILVKSSELPISYFCATKKSLFRNFAYNFKTDTTEISSILKVLQGFDEYKLKLDKLLSAANNLPYRISDKKLSYNFISNNMVISPSKIENFYTCKFKYFCKYILGVSQRRKVEFDPMQTGTFMHHILYNIVRGLGNDFATTQVVEIKAMLDVLFTKYFSDVVGSIDDKSSRDIYLYQRLNKTMLNVILHMQKEVSQSDFKPKDFEVDISFRGDINPLEIKTNTGKIFVDGRVDRIDTFNYLNKTYFRIIDYKSSDKDFSLRELYYGLNLQMLIYLFSIMEGGSGIYKNALPAGILYMPINRKPSFLGRYASDIQIEKEKTSLYKMKGMLIDNIDIINAMDKGVSNTFINAKLKKDGSFEKSNCIVSTSELRILRDYINKLVIDMENDIRHGNIEARAVTQKEKRHCDFCEYNTVCGKLQCTDDIIIEGKFDISDFKIKDKEN